MTESSKENRPTPQQLEVELFKILESATDTKVGLSSDDSVYDLPFIVSKLALCSSHMEKLAQHQLRLTLLSLEIIRVRSAKTGLLKLKHNELKTGDFYAQLPLRSKTTWLQDQLFDLEGELSHWKDLEKMVSTIKEAVADQAQTLKRLDSDLRLHSRLYEAGIAAGARGHGGPLPTETTSPSGLTHGKETSVAQDVDLE